MALLARNAPARGYSLLTVLIVVTALSVVTSAAYMLSASDTVAATARSHRALSIEAASTALNRYQQLARPSLDAAAIVPLVTESVGTMDVDGDGEADYETRYQVLNLGGEVLQGSIRVEAVGEVISLPEGNVVSRASVTSVLSTQRFVRPYENHIDNGPTAGGVMINIPLGPSTVIPSS